MKNSISILAALFFMMNASFATVRTLSNSPLGGAQFSYLGSAYDASSSNDTLLVEGTDIPYSWDCSGFWRKSLTVIGAGFNTDKQQSKKTIFIAGACDFGGGFAIDEDGSGSKFYGIYFSFGVNFTNQGGTFGGPYSNLTFEDCFFENNITPANFDLKDNAVSNLVFRNCVFNLDNGKNLILPNTAPSTVIIDNCIFDGYVTGQNNILNTLLINHCLFLRNDGEAIIDLKNASVSNSIFMNQVSVANAGTTGCNFLNNMARLSATLPPSGNSGSGNLSNTNPNFVSYTSGALYSSAQDYHLQAGSAAIGTGSDNTDIGIHGGLAHFNEHGEALNAPVMRNLVITNTTVAPNGTLNVTVVASKPNDH